MVLNDFVVDKFNRMTPVVIYGAGVYGELCLRCLESVNIIPYAFADRRSDMTHYMGIKVIAPEQIKNVKNAVVLLASVTYLKVIIDFLKHEGVDNYFIISSLLKLSINEDKLSDYTKGVRKLDREYEKAVEDIVNRKLRISNIDLVVTQYCNLRCRDCGSLMPYYKTPHHFEAAYIVNSFDRLMFHINELDELRILGGETFLYPNLTDIVSHYSTNTKIKKIYIYTNAVMLPEEDVLRGIRSDKTCLRISDYGELSRNKTALINSCEKNGILYEILNENEWRDMGGVEKRSYTVTQLKNVFNKCENAKCPSFCNGRLYICPRAAHLEKIGIFQNKEFEVMDFSSEKKAARYTKKDIEDFLYGREYFEACYYCNGNNRWENLIPPAIQKTVG
ncbi:4Fe-4S single cluster domain-containing protein [Lachnospiraceae bacterium]|nr:4Fe-4S single cluster domain-containing protein [Lachnospiraceae bacterium]